jgi:hypothetical protein
VKPSQASMVLGKSASAHIETHLGELPLREANDTNLSVSSAHLPLRTGTLECSLPAAWNSCEVELRSANYRVPVQALSPKCE